MSSSTAWANRLRQLRSPVGVVGMYMKVVLKFVAIVASLLACAFDAHAQPRTVTAAESCYAMGTLRQFRDNEFSHYSAPSAIAGSAGLGCDLLEVRGLPLGMSVMFGAFAEVQETAAFDRQSGMSGDMLTKKMPECNEPNENDVTNATIFSLPVSQKQSNPQRDSRSWK